MKTLLVILLVVLAIILIGVILIQPDRSRGIAKTANVLDQEKEGIEKFTEYVAFLFLFVAILYNIIR
ncbi:MULTISPECIES: preprotein translocase subunit SecG [Streptobacillus]|uniref:Protein-export membrane protein SecG n=2 Tax=Streptobacillus TaxID=34104 RepID=D1AY86_STRM9|nr:MULTISPECIES: preprotein translocase subunit SecG [Streptobacillus]ACZ01262.1 preprotein translocase, SecG subunit [Streptobacillus moniliformis DSM 12112]SQA13581.1 preprotein translocase, SecG subunit [Streptobacillus moniliformis]